MIEESPACTDVASGTGEETAPSGPPEKMGLSFYAALALIGLLVLMVVFLNYPAARANAGASLTQSHWTLRSYADAGGTESPVLNGTEVTAQFGRDGRVSGSAGCNGYSAGYQTRDYAINFSAVSSTKMFCQSPGIMEQESVFLAGLSGASSFRVSDTSLSLYDKSGKTVLVFAPE